MPDLIHAQRRLWPHSPDRSRHYPALDGLRGMAALVIVWHHFLQLTPVRGAWFSHIAQFFPFFSSGVDLFFVLSGFLITGILADAKFKKRYFRSFYGRRVLRIFPLYYGVLVIVLIILPQQGIPTGFPYSSHIFFWTYTSNFYFANTGWFANYLSHIWTLAIEEQFYLVWPLVLYLVPSLDQLRKALPWIFISVFILRIVLYALGFNFVWLFLDTLTHCEGLLAGAYLALAIRSSALVTLKLFRPNKVLVTILILLAFFILNENGIFSALITYHLFIANNLILLPILAILFLWLVYQAIASTDTFVVRIFSQPFLRWFGKYSYALYLFHVPLGFLVLSAKLPWFSSWSSIHEMELLLFYMGCCIGCAFLSWHLYEKHFLKLKRFFEAAEETSVPMIAVSQES